MRTLAQRLVVLLGFALLVGVVVQAEPQGMLVVALAAVTAIGIASIAFGVRAVPRRVVTVGARAREHRELLDAIPAPRHPATPGRTRSRAPGGEHLTA